MLAWVHILQQPGRADQGDIGTTTQGIDSPYSRALQCALATVKVSTVLGPQNGRAHGDVRSFFPCRR